MARRETRASPEAMADGGSPPLPGSGLRDRDAPSGPSEGEKASRSRPGPWMWILVLLLGGAGGYLGGLGSRGLPFGLTAETEEPPDAPPLPGADGTGGPRAGIDDDAAPGQGSSIPADGTVVDGIAIRLRMDYLQGDGQAAPAGTTLPGPFGVQVVDAIGQPVEGVEIGFQVVAGGGVAVPTSVRTDDAGRATANWRLGPSPGFHRLTATSSEMETVVTFTAMARPTEAPEAQGLESVPVRDAQATAAPLPETRSAPVPEIPPDPAFRRARPATVRVVPRDIAVGGSTVCGLTRTGVTCQGADERGQRIDGAAYGTLALTAGLFHVCALDAAGTASCWGANESGQLGDATRVDRDEPTPVFTELRFSTLSAGVAHTCGLTDVNRLACWGQNIGGQLGDGSRVDHTTPEVVSMPPLVMLTSGWSHSCAATASGAVYCWGLNRDGQVGDGTRLDRLTPRQVATSATSLAAGSAHTCVLSDQTVLCWGENRSGQLGDGTLDSRVSPTPVSGLPGRATALVAGAAHTCALLIGGSAYCWGQNLYGQLGNGSMASTPTPVAVAGGITFARLAAGGGVTCGISTGDVEYCWGLNQSGQLGDGSRTNRAAPVRAGS